MKNLLTALCLFCSLNSFGQISEVRKCGLDDNANLNEFEAKYFNEVFEDKKGDFDFTEKVTAFYAGSSGTAISSKSYYFSGLRTENNGDRDVHARQAERTQLLILTAEEKERSGGYDAILISWSKLLIVGKSRARLIERLGSTGPNKP